MTNIRIRKVRSSREFEEVRDEYITRGYKIKDEGIKTCKLLKAEYGSVASHALIFLMTAWWTFFIGNILWLIYQYMSNSDSVLLKLVDSDE